MNKSNKFLKTRYSVTYLYNPRYGNWGQEDCWALLGRQPYNYLGNSRLVRDSLRKEVGGIWELTLEAVLSLTMLCLHTDIHIHTSKLFLKLMCKQVFCLRVCLCTTFVPAAAWGQKVVDFPRTGVIEGCEPPWFSGNWTGVLWKSSPYSSTVKPPFQPA